MTGITAPTIGEVRVITRAALVGARLLAMAAFVPPVESKRAPLIEYV